MSFAAGAKTGRSLLPAVKNSGAPHSSVSTCDIAWQRMPWWRWQIAESARELAAVPLKTKKTSQSVSKISVKRRFARAVYGSSP